MPQFEFLLTRNFYVTDTVAIEAASESEAYDQAVKQFDTLTSELPTSIYEYLEFEDYDITPLE